jgi:hypothetical protein
LVEIRGVDNGMAVNAQAVAAPLIGHDQDDIWAG